MAFTHGRKTVLIIGGNNITAYANESSLERGADSHDVTVYGATAHAVGDDGLLKHSFSCGGIYDNSAAGPHDILAPMIGTNVTLIRRPEGTGSGLPQETCTIRVTKYTESSPVADYVKWSLDGDVSGVITDTNQP